jgi:pentatricopeptide repeat protein
VVTSASAQLQANAYGIAISACGRAGQLGRALALRDEMVQRGLEVTLNARLALLHAYAGGHDAGMWASGAVGHVLRKLSLLAGGQTLPGGASHSHTQRASLAYSTFSNFPVV